MLGKYPLFARTGLTVPTPTCSLIATTGVTGVIESGIDAWADQSGNGNDWVATSPNRPVWDGDYFATGKHAVNFPSFEVDYFTKASAITFAAGLTFFAVFKTVYSSDTTSTDAMNAPLTLIGHNATDYVSFGLSGNNIDYRHRQGSTTTVASSGLSLANGSLHSIAVVHASGGGVTLYADGVSAGTGTKTFNTSCAVNRIGVGKANADQLKDVFVAEIKMWQGELSASQISLLHSTAASYWV
jgi:hypothetical protein